MSLNCHVPVTLTLEGAWGGGCCPISQAGRPRLWEACAGPGPWIGPLGAPHHAHRGPLLSRTPLPPWRAGTSKVSMSSQNSGAPGSWTNAAWPGFRVASWSRAGPRLWVVLRSSLLCQCSLCVAHTNSTLHSTSWGLPENTPRPLRAAQVPSPGTYSSSPTLSPGHLGPECSLPPASHHICWWPHSLVPP